MEDIFRDQLFPSCCLATNQGGGWDAWGGGGGGGTISGNPHNFVGIAFTTALEQQQILLRFQ